MDWVLLINIVNIVGAVVFPVLLVATIARQISRVRWYWHRSENPPVILKRGLGLMVAFAILFGSGVVIRVLGLTAAVAEPGPLRFWYLLCTTTLSIAVFAYYAKTEYIDMEDPRKK